jgi:hypothetical protein
MPVRFRFDLPKLATLLVASSLSLDLAGPG